MTSENRETVSSTEAGSFMQGARVMGRHYAAEALSRAWARS